MQALFGHGVAKVLDSKHPDYKEGDFVWGPAVWEEYSLVEEPNLTKIHHTDVPLSCYTGILGQLFGLVVISFASQYIFNFSIQLYMAIKSSTIFCNLVR